MIKLTQIHLFIGLMIAFGMLPAESIPKDPLLKDYQGLLRRPLFTQEIKAEVAAPIEKKNSTTYYLRGVSKFEEGWFVSLVDVKNPKQTIFLKEGASDNAQGLRLVKVRQNKDDFTQTRVLVMASGQQITLGYNLRQLKRSITTPAKPTTPLNQSQNQRQFNAGRRTSTGSTGSADSSIKKPNTPEGARPPVRRRHIHIRSK